MNKRGSSAKMKSGFKCLNIFDMYYSVVDFSLKKDFGGEISSFRIFNISLGL